MRKKAFKRLSVILTVVFLTTLMPFGDMISHAASGLVEDFSDGVLTGWSQDANYRLTEANGELKIEANKANNPWASFTFSFSALDISAKPYVSVRIKSEVDLQLNFSIWDTAGNYRYPRDDAVNTSQEIVASDHYAVYTFDFSGLSGIDLKNIRMLNFVFNPGTPGAKGTVYFDDLKIGDAADVAPRMTAIPPQQTYINAPEQRVLLRGIHDGTDGSHPVSITAVSSNPSLIPHPTIEYSGGSTGTLKYTPAANQTGTATITVTASAAGTSANKQVQFDISVEKNLAPRIDQVSDQVAKAGSQLKVALTGIDDGNPNARQNITVTASSSNPSLIPHPTVLYSSDDMWGSLLLAPSSGMTGSAVITVTVRDDGGTLAGGQDTSQMSFNVNVYPNINNPPKIDPIGDVSAFENDGEHRITLTGIDDGDEGVVQNLSFSAVSSNPAVVPNPTVEYSQGSSTALLKFTPAPGQTGTAVITVTVTDDGGRPDNIGNASVETSFEIQVRVRPVTGFEDDFNDGVIDPRWTYSGEGCHFCTEEGGALRIYIDKYITNNPWAGLWFAIPTELDLSENPYISITMKCDTPPTDMLIFLWDYKDAYNTAGTVIHTVTGQYVEYYFDFTGKLLQSDGEVVDISRIKALLFNFAPGKLYKGTFWFDDLRVGDKAHRPPVTPKVTIDPLPDIAVAKDSGQQTILLTGITDGKGNNDNITLSAASSNPSVIPAPSVSGVSDGIAVLTFTPAAGATGRTTIMVTGTAPGSAETQVAFTVDVVDMNPASAINVSVDKGIQYQEIDGFGAFLGSGDVSQTAVNVQLPMVNDIGMSMARFGVIDDYGFEPKNDNSNPYVTNYDAYDYSAIPYEAMKQYKEKTGIDKFILTFWSPSAWMKKNKWPSAQSWAQDNILEPHYYEEYAEELVAAIKTIKYKTGIDLYAISPQNEPEFNEPYPSCVIRWNEYRDLMKVVGPRFAAEGITTKVFMPEALPAQGHIDEYINAINSDPVARNYVHIIATHNYDADGIHVGGPGADTWAQIYSWAQQPPAKKTWMTETSGHSNNWEGALTLAGNLYNALRYGNISAWVWWSFNATPESEVYGLLVNGQPTSRYAVSKQFYKFIQPGAVRVECSSADNDVLALAFNDAGRSKVTVVLINRSDATKLVRVTGSGLPSLYETYVTSNHRLCTRGEDAVNGLVLLPPSSVTTLYGTPGGGDTIPPTAPGNLRVTGKTSTTVDLAWDASTDNEGVAGYNVYIGDSKVNPSLITSTAYTVQDLSPATTYTFTVKAVDYAQNLSPASNPVEVTTDPLQGIIREYWLNVGGANVSAIPLQEPPDGTDVLTSLEGPVNWADDYGARIRAYLTPAVSGDYTFYIASDDNSELWLSTDQSPANKVRIAHVPGWTSSRLWTKYPEQQSAAISLNAGTRYYIEVLHKEGNGGDNVAVGWTGPGIPSITVIGAEYLSPFDPHTGSGTGLKGEYFDNRDLTDLKLTRTDAVINFDWGNGSPDPSIGADTFSVRWTGQVEPLYSETYTFYTNTDDGVRLWVDGQLIIDKWIDQSPTEWSGTIALNAGQRYDIKMEFYENGGGAVAKLLWSSPSQQKEIIPQSQLYPEEAPGTGLKGEYYDNSDLTNLVLTRIDAAIDFNWGTDAPDPSVGPETFSVRWSGCVVPKYSETYTFYTNTDDGVRLWVNGELIVDKWINQAATEWSGTITLEAGWKYSIIMEYYDNTHVAVAQLLWSSPSQPKEVIPQSQLYPPDE